MAPRHSAARPANGHRHRHGDPSKRKHDRKRRSHAQRPGTSSDESRNEAGSAALSREALARLERENARHKRKTERTKKAKGADYREVNQEQSPKRERHKSRPKDEERPKAAKDDKKKKKKRRVVSGAIMEEGRAQGAGLRGGRGDEWRWSDQSFEKGDFYRRPPPKKTKRRKKLWILLGCIAAIVVIVIVVVAVVVSQKNGSDGSSGSSSLDGQDHKDIPDKWQNTYLDPWSWETTEDFNVTFTDEMVGGLPVMGLMSDWDDSTRAHDGVPPLDEEWGDYSKKPARGMNLGGWLSLEPFVTPSLFSYPEDEGIVDEWNLCQKLGSRAPSTLEKHYATFVSEDDFRQMAEAGMDHVRIPYSYWAVEVYDGDPYVFRTSWRYLLRGIEWARKHGLRVNLDLHGLPGSQNGFNHSGRKGAIGWLKGPDGQKNADRSIEIHERLSAFFAQDRYRNVITHYGLANEPKMTDLDPGTVVGWTERAYEAVRAKGVKALVVFGDGFMGLDNWQGLMTGYDTLVLDVHQYVIFNDDLIGLTHKRKVEYACKGWTEQTELSLDRSRGYGPTLFAEWSQADTDCQPLLNGGLRGSRWDGTLPTEPGSTGDGGGGGGPRCPAGDGSCSCAEANSGVGGFSDEYKRFLQMFAEAQMHSFEVGWGWWYWTWKTENAPLWSYKAGLDAGILPKKAYERDFNCDSDVPDFGKKGLSENY